MTPRRRLSAEERREQLVAATVAVLAEVGYARTTADAIARSAGVSKGLLWHYFDDLDDLMEQTARHTLAGIASYVGASIDLTAPVPELLRAAIRRAAGLSLTHAPQRRALGEIVPNLRTADGTARLTVQDYAGLHAAQEEIFRRGQREGDVRAELDPRVLAVTYQGAVDAMLAYLDAHPDVDAERFADRVADALLAGVRASAE